VAINGATSSSYTTNTLSNNDVIYVTAAEGAATVSSSGLVLNLDAGNALSYTSGNAWTDLSGSANHGALNNVTYSTSNQGYFSFNGSTSYVSLPNSTDFNFGTGDFTIELWLEKTSGTSTPNFLAINSNSGFYSSIRIGWSPNINGNPTLTFAHSTNGTSWNIQTGVTSSLSTWSQIVLSRSAGVVTVYVNGVNKGSYNLSSSLMTTTTSSPIYNQIGTLPNWPSVYTLLGKMSIIRYYKTTGLTSAQVVSNYNAICSRYGLSAIGIASNSITTTITAGPSGTLTVLGDGCINKTTLSTTSGQTSYTWYKDGGAISGATNNTYKPAIAGEYKVQVSNGTCGSMSTTTIISTCGVTASGRMSILETSTTLVSKSGAKNSGKGVSERGKILTQPTPPVVTTGLQLYYDMNNALSYSGSGPTLTDLSGNGRHGTLENSPSFTTLSATGGGGVLSFNGTNQYISTTYTPANTCTISIWFYNNLNYTDFNRGIFSTYHNPNSTNGIYMGTRSSSLNLSRDANVGYATTVVPSLSINTWYNITVTSDASGSSGTGTIKVYLNGNLQTTLTGAKTTHATVLNIGRSRYDSNYWSGYLGSAMVYNTALSDNDVLTNYNAQKTRFGY
jgi:hypothetical protein